MAKRTILLKEHTSFLEIQKGECEDVHIKEISFDGEVGEIYIPIRNIDDLILALLKIQMEDEK